MLRSTLRPGPVEVNGETTTTEIERYLAGILLDVLERQAAVRRLCVEVETSPLAQAILKIFDRDPS